MRLLTLNNFLMISIYGALLPEIMINNSSLLWFTELIQLLLTFRKVLTALRACRERSIVYDQIEPYKMHRLKSLNSG